MAGTTPLTQAYLRSQFIAGYNANATIAARTDDGSTLGAIANGGAQVAETLDGDVQDIALLARAATSTGAALYSFWAPFGIAPIPATASSGVVTVAINSTLPAPTPVYPGLIVQTKATQSSPAVQFLVIADNTKSGWTGTYYTIPAGSLSVDVSVICLTLGTAGNVQAGAIESFYSSNYTDGVTYGSVTNALDFDNGKPQETDPAFNARASQLQSSRRVGTSVAILAAIAGVQTGLTYQFGNCINPDGSAHAAFFTVIVDVLGTSGGPSSALLAACAAAIDGGTYNGVTYPQVIAAGMQRAIVGPTEVPINVTAVLKLAPGAVSGPTIAAAQAALQTYLNYFPLAAVNSATIVSYSQVIAQLLKVPGVSDPTSVTISAGGGSAGTANLSIGFGNRPVAGTLTFTTA